MPKMTKANSSDVLMQGLKILKDNEELFYIEFQVALTTIALAFLVLFGSFRRFSHNQLLKILMWLAYFLSSYLVSNALGEMKSAKPGNELFPIWASFLMIALGSADSITAYSISDNENRKRFLAAYVLNVVWWNSLVSRFNSSLDPSFSWMITALNFVMIMKISERTRAFKRSSQSALVSDSKLVADYMSYEHELSHPDEVDPVNMNGYKYLVRGDDEKMVTVTPPLYYKKLEITNHVVTIDQVWKCKGSLLTKRRDPDNQIKDICLSYALYRMLCRRFSGYPFSESSNPKAWKFLRHSLLSEEGDFERPFRVIETELSFLFDLFYTKYPVIFDSGRWRTKVFELVFVILGCVAAVSGIQHYHPHKGYAKIKVYGLYLDIIVTIIGVCVILFIEVVQFLFVIFSDWTKVILICKYVQKPFWQNRKCIGMMVRVICRGRLFSPWERKIGQYSLLKSYTLKPTKLLYNRFTTDFIDPPREGQGGTIHATLPAAVKRSIVLSLQINGQRLTNGEASLRRNGVETELLWACRLETTTHVIMVWHIATLLCEIASSESVPQSQLEQFTVATKLSKYCAHLVATAPRFLPDHSYVTESIFDQIIIETREHLAGCKSMEEKFQKMMAIGDEEQGESMIKRGSFLGKQLISIVREEDLGWKILAEFWAELMLFVSPSDDVAVHGEHLATGGQFITHLWALLSHGGILRRETVAPNVEIAPSF